MSQIAPDGAAAAHMRHQRYPARVLWAEWLTFRFTSLLDHFYESRTGR